MSDRADDAPRDRLRAGRDTATKAAAPVSVRSLPARLLVGFVAALLLTACGIRSDAEPRDITGDRQQQLGDVGRSSNETPAGGSRIYLVDAASSTQNPVLRAVPRDVPTEPKDVLQALLDGPTVSERTGRLRTAVPADTMLLGVQFDGPGIITVNLSPKILEASGDGLVDAVAQIVYTLAERDDVKGVQLRVDGQARQWPSGDGTLTSSALTVYLYPGRAASVQPDFPALPSVTPTSL